MGVFAKFFYTLIVLFICRASAAPFHQQSVAEPLCLTGHLLTPGQGGFVFTYKTEVQLSVANGNYDLKSEINADVHIKHTSNCVYLLQLRNVRVTETKDESQTPVTSNAQRELENLVVRFRWVDGFLLAIEADSAASIDHVNFVKGVVSLLQVYSPVPTDNEDIIREEDILGVCTTRYKYSPRGGSTQITKDKDLSTCSRDKLHLSSSPVLTALLGPLIEEVFTAKTHYVCQTDINDKKIQSVKCKTIEIESDDRSTKKQSHHHDDDHIHHTDESSEEHDVDFNDRDDGEISSKLVSIKQELRLQQGGYANVDENSLRNPVRQTLQFVPTASFDKSNEPVSQLVSEIEALLNTANWDQFAAARFVEIANELRRMNPANLNAFKANSQLKHLVPTLLDKVYSHDPSAALLNLDQYTKKFSNPLSVVYLDKPSNELVDQILQAARGLTAQQAPEFVGLAASILKKYKARQINPKTADNKIKEFQRSISGLLSNPSSGDTSAITAVLSAYAHLGLYDDQVKRLAENDQSSLEVQYHALNVIKHICDDYIEDHDERRIRTDLQNFLLRKLQNKANKNAVRVWAFEALYTSFIYNPEESGSTLGDDLEKALANILNEPLNQVNGYMWSVLKYSSLDRLCPLRGLSSRLRVHHDNKQQFAEQETLSSRQIEIDLPLRKNYRVLINFRMVFENDRVVPSFLAVKLAFDGIRRETLRLPWVDLALISENLDWNFADYFLRLDPLNKNFNTDENQKNQAKYNLPPGLKRLQDTFESKPEDPDPSVHLYLQLFGADIRSRDVTNKVQDLLRSNIRTFARNQILERLRGLLGKNPIFRIPIEIGAAVGAANGLTLYKSAQIGLLADLSNDLKDTRDPTGLGSFSLTSRSVLSCSLTLQREVSSPLTSIGEVVDIGVLSNVPFEYKTDANNDGKIREFNLLNPKSKLFTTDFQYSLRTSKGLETERNPPSPSIDPSCTPSIMYRGLGIRACLELNPFRSIQIGTRPLYPMSVDISKEPSIQKWRIGWKFNAPNAPQYEVAVDKVGATETYPGLGISATKNGNNFDIKVLNGMKSFIIKGAQIGDRFTGSVFTNDNKEVMKTEGTLTTNNNEFKLNSKLTDAATNREVAAITTEILPNRGQGLTANIGLSTPDQSKSFKIHFRGDLYKPDSKLLHINGEFNLGGTSYEGKAHLERGDEHTRIELQRSMKAAGNPTKNGYEFLYDRKKTPGPTQNNHNIEARLVLNRPTSPGPSKIFDLKADFARTKDLSNATLHSTLDFLILSRNPPVDERIELDYARRSLRTMNQARRLISPEASLKIEVQTKSKVFDFLLDHRHRRSSEVSAKGPEMLPPTLDIKNKIHIVADTDRLLPDIPRPFAFDISSDLDFELLNKIDYKFQYDLRRRQRSGSLSYNGQVDRVVDGHMFIGRSNSEVQWDNKQKKATATGTFSICTRSRTLKTHWDIDTNIVPNRNDIQLDLTVRFDRQPKRNSPKSFIGVYNITVNAPQHEPLQFVDLIGNITRQTGLLKAFNTISYRLDKSLKEINLNAVIDRNQTGDGGMKTHLTISLPFKYIPYITHDLELERDSPTGRLNNIHSKLHAKPVLLHYAHIHIDRSKPDQPPHVHVENELEYLRANGDNLFGVSKVDVHRWSKLHSSGSLRRNTDVLHKHSIGYIFSSKTRRVALSLKSPQLSGNPLSIIGELTIDRENRIGKMRWPQEFGVHLEFGTPISNLTAVKVYYKLPIFNKDIERNNDVDISLKLASSNIAPISLNIHSEGSLNTTLHIRETINVGDDIALTCLLTAQYTPNTPAQISLATSSKYYERDFQNSIYVLLKEHQFLVRGILNTTDNQDFKYDLDVGFDDSLLTGHSERTDGQQTAISDIEARRCPSTGRYENCYRGDITIQSGSGGGRRGTFDLSWGRGIGKLDVRVPDQIEIKFDHEHTGRIRDEDFNSKTNIAGKFLRPDNRGAFSYSGSVNKVDGKWNNAQFRSSLNEMKTGQKAIDADINLNQQIIDKFTGKFQRKITVNFERQGQPVINWSSDSSSCQTNPSNVLYGICQTTKFNIKASNRLAQRLRERLHLPADPRLSNPSGQVNYDGTLNLDLKHDPQSGPHTAKLDLNRLQEDAVDLDVTFQPRTDNGPMSLNLKANLPRQNPISVKYDETLRSRTNFNGVLKYSFNANDMSTEKTYQCEVDRPSAEDVSINCKGERTTLVIDIDRNAGKSKVYVDLNKFAGERVGFEGTRDPRTNEVDATLYTFVSSWNLKRQPGRSTTVTVRQKGQEVLRVEGTKNSDREIEVKFSPSNVGLKLDWDDSTIVTLKQTYPQQRNIATITIDRKQIRPYLPSLRNENRPAHDIDEPFTKLQTPLVEIALDSHTLVSVSHAIEKLGSHNGLYGLDTIKKLYKLQIGDASLFVYNIQHWKTHFENFHLPESFFLRILNSATGNFVQLSTYKWNEQRLVTKLAHSFDGGRSLTTDLKLDRNYALQVGSVYFLHSLGYRNMEAAKQLRNVTRNFVREHLRKDFAQTNGFALLKDLRTRLRSIIEKDYSAVQEIVNSWNQEAENSFLRRFSNRLGLPNFFVKYPTYSQASDRIFQIIFERAKERDEFWRNRIEGILNDNRLKDLSKRFLQRRAALIKRLSERSEKILDRFLPKIDQSQIDRRIADYVTKIISGVEQTARRNAEYWKGVFKSIDEASRGDDTKWFRTLVADIDSNKFAEQTDQELSRVFKKLGDSSKLFISNIQQISRRITKRRESIRERVQNAIRHLPKASINDTGFEFLFPVGFKPGSYMGTNEIILGVGSLLRNRDQAFDTIRSVLQNRLESRAETFQNYMKAVRSLAKRLLRRNPSLTPEFKAVIAQTGDALDVHGNYIYLNPQCDYVLAHDFADLKFSFRFNNGKVYSSSTEIKDYECSNTGRVQICSHGTFYTISIPMHYGGRVSGALGDVRDRAGVENNDLSRWSLQGCPSSREPPRGGEPPIIECGSEDEDKEEFCENFVRRGLRSGLDRRRLIIHALEAREQTV